jgi:hypothetical protein
MPFKHYFQCQTCKQHLITYSDAEMPISPGHNHYTALANGALPRATSNRAMTTTSCLGRIMYCAGFDKFGVPCGGNHARGTEAYNPDPPPRPNAEWKELAERVDAAWHAYVTSGYSPALRGPNHDRSYRIRPGALDVLRSSGGLVVIHGGVYTVSNSLTSDVSLKRNAGGHMTFIFHL